MKFRIFILLFAFYTFASIGNSNAAFIVKKANSAESAKTSAPGPGSRKMTNKRALISNFKAIKKIAFHEQEKPKRHRDSSGWEGIVALCCGVLGFFSLGILSVPAIIFGAIGMARYKKNKGLAIAGMVLGILMVLFMLLAVAFLVAFFGL